MLPSGNPWRAEGVEAAPARKDVVATILETDRLLLRTLTLDDAEALLTVSGDPEVMRFLGGIPDQTIEDVHKRVQRTLAHYERYGFGYWAVIDKATGRLLGVCGIKPLEDGPEIEVGYHFARAAWNQGYATEAARACLRYAFEHLKLERVLGVVHPDNHASQRVLEKCGLTYERMGHHYKTDCKVYVATCVNKGREACSV
jgi:ribosomal-protein-alanine N-acetyltransferase